MAANRTTQFDRGAPPPIVARPSLCETDHCQTPAQPRARRNGPPEATGTPETLSSLWCPAPCRSTCLSCSPPRHTGPSLGCVRAPVPLVVRPQAPTFTSAPDGGGSPFRPERSVRNQRHRRSLSLEAAQIGRSFLKCRFVGLLFHRVFGAQKRKAFLFHDSSQFILAAADPRLLDQVGAHTSWRPNADAVSPVPVTAY